MITRSNFRKSTFDLYGNVIAFSFSKVAMQFNMLIGFFPIKGMFTFILKWVTTKHLRN